MIPFHRYLAQGKQIFPQLTLSLLFFSIHAKSPFRKKNYLSYSSMVILHQIEWVTDREAEKEMPAIFSSCGHHIWLGPTSWNANTNFPLYLKVSPFSIGNTEWASPSPSDAGAERHITRRNNSSAGPQVAMVWYLGSCWGEEATCSYFTLNWALEKPSQFSLSKSISLVPVIEKPTKTGKSKCAKIEFLKSDTSVTACPAVNI